MAPTLDESGGGRDQIATLLKDATDTISREQTLMFEPYVRLVLPADGYVFWVRATQVNPAALYNVMAFNTVPFNATSPGLVAMDGFPVMGSVHYQTALHQDETATVAINRMFFTSEDRIQRFNDVGPNLIYIATFNGIRFAFSSQGVFYEQDKLWHYEGNALYSTTSTQVVDDPRVFLDKLIVSNSLPAWLSLSHYAPPYPVEVPMPRVVVYPSFLVPLNLPPPFVSVHIGAEDTSADQAVPSLDRRLTQRQLARDQVRVTLWGLDNDTAQDWLMATLGYMRDAGVIGLCNDPIITDHKLTQDELLIIAKKKSIDFEVSYNQGRVRDVARQFIESVTTPIITAVSFTTGA